MTKTITFSALSVPSIDKAIRELREFQDLVRKATEELVRVLTERGKEAAQLEILRLGAFDTGQLVDTMTGVFDSGSRTGIIATHAYYAVFVEYGTGVIGESESYTGTFWPGPVTVKGKTYTRYDTNHHGDAGWLYISDRDGRLHWTRGRESSPFMYNTYRQLQQMANSVANEVFNRRIGGGQA